MRLVVLKTLAKLTFGIAALAAATSFGTSTSRAFGDAPWCAVKNLGKGDVYWDCQYLTFEACYPNALADRGFCNVNQWPGPSQLVPFTRNTDRPAGLRRISPKLPELLC
jgi:hypothetical protein